MRINKHDHEERSERGRAETRFQKDYPNADQREEEREDHVAHQERSGSRGHLHRVHSRVEEKPSSRIPSRCPLNSPTATRSPGF